MIKLLVFDDAALFNINHIYFESLNKSLSSLSNKYCISESDFVKICGLSCPDKFMAISELNGLPAEYYKELLKLRRKIALSMLVHTDPCALISKETVESLKKIKCSYALNIASNEPLDFISVLLYTTHTAHLFSRVFTEASVHKLKPSSEMYLRCMVKAAIDPFECLAFENTSLGQESAKKAGAFTNAIENPGLINLSQIENKIDNCYAKV